MQKHKISMTLNDEEFSELMGLVRHKRDSSPSAKKNAAAAAIHAAYSKLPEATKKALREEHLQTGVFEKISQMFDWMNECKKKGGIA